MLNIPSSVYTFTFSLLFALIYGLHFFHIRNIGHYHYASYLSKKMNLKHTEALKAARQNHLVAFWVMVIGGLVAIISLSITVASWLK